MSAKFFLNAAGSEDKSILETKGKDLQPSHEANNTENIIIANIVYLSLYQDGDTCTFICKS